METTLEKIERMLGSQKFSNWYNSGRFNAYIRGEDNAPSREEIFSDLSKMLER